MIWCAILLVAFVHLCVAKPLSKHWNLNDLAVKHAWSEIPRGWVYESPAPADFLFEMRIGLKQDKIDDLIASLMETSDPNHARYVESHHLKFASENHINTSVRYGKHLTKAETDAFVAAHPDSHEAVNSWLEYHGVKPEDITHDSGGGDWVILRVTVGQAERMLNTKYNIYHHPGSSERIVRTMGYSLPRELHSHVDVVAPTTYFSTLRSMRVNHFVQSVATQIEDVSQGQSNSAAVPSSNCDTNITPSCLRTLYNTINYTPIATKVNKLGVAGYLDQYANRADLQVRFLIFVI
jgi:tripeptidyl-peptidase I